MLLPPVYVEEETGLAVSLDLVRLHPDGDEFNHPLKPNKACRVTAYLFYDWLEFSLLLLEAER